MSHDGFAALEAQLGTPPPQALAELEPGQLSELATAVREARRRQATELSAAGEKAFNVIPRLLRGPIKKILG